jgi:TRAP transporter 4TM/12TM fusion protein
MVVLFNFGAVTTIRIKRFFVCLLLVAAVACSLYIVTEARRLEMNFGLEMSSIDFLVGIVMVCIVIVVTGLLWGKTIPILGTLAVLYFFFGHNIPGVLGFPLISKEMVIAYLGMGISAGIYGYLLPISAGLVFYFMLFGGIMGATGMLPMFLELGKWLGRGTRGGAAYTALVGSSLMGTVTGATVANVAFTGQYTIPAMKSQGFTGSSASAVESVASMGGQLLPPVMGAGAFIMAVITGVPYITICQKAILPAILYYIGVVIGTSYMVSQHTIQTASQLVNFRLIIERVHVFIVPLGVLVYLLMMKYSPGLSITVSLFVCIVISLIVPTTRPNWCSLIEGFIEGAKMGAEMAVAITTIAIIAQVAITTALGPKIGHALMGVSGGIDFLGLIMMMVLCLFLGLGMPTVAAYTMVAIVAVPGIVDMGIDKFAAHFFAYYFAILAAVTPPVATAAIVGSKIAKSDFWACAFSGFKLALPVFIIPFAFVNQPDILDFPYIDFWGLAMVGVTILYTISLSALIFQFSALSGTQKGLYGISVATSFVYIVLIQHFLLLVISAATLGFAIFRRKALRA